tara:strand:+ start:1763 stop:2542 length:780 start_codon:yes stop_codon:yes gene_type:complete
MVLIRSFLIIVFWLSIPVYASLPTTPLRVAVAANFAPVLEKLLPQFTQQSQIPVQIISGASGTLYLQINHGAPFDVFLSADDSRPKKLQADNLTLTNTLETYAYGQLALWSAVDKLSLAKLSKIIKNNRLAISNPNTAPYGKAAKETLEALKLWQHVQNKLITGININQTFQQVRSQAVNFGLVANSQLVLNQLTGTVIPSEYHQPIRQQLVILKSSKQQTNAIKFSQFLLSDKIQQQIQQLGYALNLDKKKNNNEQLK